MRKLQLVKELDLFGMHRFSMVAQRSQTTDYTMMKVPDQHLYCWLKKLNNLATLLIIWIKESITSSKSKRIMPTDIVHSQM